MTDFRAWFFAWLVIFGMGLAVAIDATANQLNQRPWHIDCPTAAC